MSKEKATTASRVSNPGTWTLTHNSSRSIRINDFREFKEDCLNTHENLCGAAAGAFLKTGSITARAVSDAPDVPMRSDFEKDGSFFDKDIDPERAYLQASAVYQGKHAMYLTSVKSAQHHKDDCETNVLPKTFVWILSRLDRDLRSRVDQDATFAALETAAVRDPVALLKLVEAVMSKGDMDDEGRDDYVAVRDLFGDLVLKDTQSLTDGVRMFRDKMAHIQSKPAYYCKYNDDLGTEQIKQAFTEEFFVHLMFDNLPKKYDEAKVAYANQVSSSAIIRIVTFDALVKYFSLVRNVATGESVSATALATTGSTKKGKGKDFKSKPKSGAKTKDKAASGSKPKRVFVPGTHRECRHCKGAHFDDMCPQGEKRSTKSSASDPSQEEISKVLAYLNAKKAEKQAKEAKALAAQRQQCTAEEMEILLEQYAASGP
jgi:hypothetical protein